MHHCKECTGARDSDVRGSATRARVTVPVVLEGACASPHKALLAQGQQHTVET